MNKMVNISRISKIPTLPRNMQVIIKCLSAVLDIRYREGEFALDTVMKALVSKQERLAEKRARLVEKRARLAEKQGRLAEKRARLAAESEIARLRQQLASKGADRPEGTQGQIECEAADSEVVDQEPESEEVEAIEEIGIKHPYLGVGTLYNHPFFVMRDMGTTLHDLVYGAGSDFRARWRASPAMREAFLEDVGLTALNLVVECEVCHNDIRLPNIAFQEGRFCLLDFDMACKSPQFLENSAFSPKMTAAKWMSPPAELMAYSVAQIAVNVFVLDSAGGSDAGEAPVPASCIWSTKQNGSAVDVAFERWAAAKGAGVFDFLSAVRDACLSRSTGRLLRLVPPTHCRDYFARVLRDMLA